MESATAISYELDDALAAAKELVGQIKGRLDMRRNAVAILHGQPDMEIGRLSAAVSAGLGCHVVGGTAAAGAVLTNDGFHELAVVLHVLTDDDCLFSAAISGPMEADPEKEIRQTYKNARGGLMAQDPAAVPKLAICVAANIEGYATDSGLEELSCACGGLPIFGYIAGDDFEFTKQKVFLDGEVGGERFALLLIAGNISPIFQVENLAGKQTLEKKLVTKSYGNIIYEIDGKPAFEYLKDFPFIDDETKALYNYQFFVEMKNAADDDGALVSRALHKFDRESGAVVCFANVPQGSHIGLRYCDGDDVAATCENGLVEFNEKLKAAAGGYSYSTVLIVTCSLRNMFLADRKETEGNLAKELLPPSLSVSGLYCFGEIAPTSARGGKAVNRFHNATFTACAF